MSGEEPLEGLDGPACALVGVHRDRHALSAGQFPVMVQRIGPVNEVLKLAVDIIVVGRRPNHEHVAVQYLLHDVVPVVGLVYAPLLLLSLLAAKAGLDFLPGKRYEFGFYSRIFAALEDY